MAWVKSDHSPAKISGPKIPSSAPSGGGAAKASKAWSLSADGKPSARNVLFVDHVIWKRHWMLKLVLNIETFLLLCSLKLLWSVKYILFWDTFTIWKRLRTAVLSLFMTLLEKLMNLFCKWKAICLVSLIGSIKYLCVFLLSPNILLCETFHVLWIMSTSRLCRSHRADP